jgi:hypothetical protein
MRKGNASIARREMRHLLPPGHQIPAKPMREDNRRAFSGDFIANACIGSFYPAGAAWWGGKICWVGHGGLVPKSYPTSWAKIICLSWAGAAAKAC